MGYPIRLIVLFLQNKTNTGKSVFPVITKYWLFLPIKFIIIRIRKGFKMGTYGKRFILNSIKGKYVAESLGLTLSKSGYYETSFGKKTACGLYLTVKNIMKNASQIKN